MPGLDLPRHTWHKYNTMLFNRKVIIEVLFALGGFSSAYDIGIIGGATKCKQYQPQSLLQSMDPDIAKRFKAVNEKFPDALS